MATIQHKTPGVYISEPNSFPPAVVGVETAVPVFIGYTQQARDKSKDLNLAPTPISSMAEYVAKFGGGFRETYYLLDGGTPVPGADYKVADVTLYPGGPSYHLVESGKANFNMSAAMKLFYANGGADCYIVSVGQFYDAGSAIPEPIDADQLILGLEAVKNMVGPTMLVVPDAVLLGDERDNGAQCARVQVAMLQQCHEQGDRIALLDVWGTDRLAETAPIAETIDRFRVNLAGAPQESLRYGAAYFPNLLTSLVSTNDISISFFDNADQRDTLKKALKEAAKHIYPDQPGQPNPRVGPVNAYIEMIGETIDDTAETRRTPQSQRADKKMTHSELTQALLANLPPLQDLFAHVAESQNDLPPSPAMAGVYTMVDSTRGFWNAPANVGIATLVRPTVSISNEQQEDLNVPTEGKAVNAIRTFPTRGPLVWGARTLDSNSNDWKYIQVRRTMIYVEQSVKTSLNSFVFAPNTASTWTTVVSMVESFLHGLWAAGGLMGASPGEAYSVACGLGTTMTADDILAGNMIVHVVLQMVHPAEFIELVFKQQMLGGA